jgi:hypothetical protein
MSEDLREDGGSGNPYSFGARKAPRKTGVIVWVVVAVVALGAGFLGARWWLGKRAEPVPAPATVQSPAPPAAAAPAAPVPPADPVTVKALLEAVSPNALYRAWVAQADLARRWAVVTENLAEGVVPRAPLAALAPAKPFAVVEKGGRTLVATESYRRYDAVADAVASVDARALAQAYRTLQPAVEAAFRALGYPQGSLDRVTARALRRIEKAPVQEGDLEVQVQGGLYTYVESRLENLTPVDKQVLRMGPRNGRILQAKARELEEALGLTGQ